MLFRICMDNLQFYYKVKQNFTDHKTKNKMADTDNKEKWKTCEPFARQNSLYSANYAKFCRFFYPLIQMNYLPKITIRPIVF